MDGTDEFTKEWLNKQFFDLKYRRIRNELVSIYKELEVHLVQVVWNVRKAMQHNPLFELVSVTSGLESTEQDPVAKARSKLAECSGNYSKQCIQIARTLEKSAKESLARNNQLPESTDVFRDRALDHETLVFIKLWLFQEALKRIQKRQPKPIYQN